MKNKCICIVDSGYGVDYAEHLVKEGYRVLYYLPNDDPYKCPNKDEIGTGFDGIERIYSLYNYIKAKGGKDDIVDLFFFVDSQFSDLQELLINLGYRVCGCRGTERFELDKWFFLQTLKKVGLPVPPAVRVQGVDALRKELEKRKDGYVKISWHRGVMETCAIKYMDEVIDDISLKIGQFKNDMWFILQDKIESKLEIGFDSWCIDGEYPQEVITGIEIKDKGYVCSVGPMPHIFDEVNKKMKPILSKLRIQGHYSNEVRVGEEDDKVYFIDPTPRKPSPPGELMPMMVKDYGKILFDLAEGKVPEPEYTHKYGAQIMLKSPWHCEHWIRVKYPEELAPWIKLRNHCIKDGVRWCIPNGSDDIFGAVIAVGNSVEEVCKLVEERCKEIEVYKFECMEGLLDTVNESIEKAEDCGIEF